MAEIQRNLKSKKNLKKTLLEQTVFMMVCVRD